MKANIITIKNHRIAYYESGHSQSNATIVFIHGNSCNAMSFYHLLKCSLSKSYRLIAIDLPGHGESNFSAEPEKDYTIIPLGKIVAEVVNELVTGKFILAGNSMGAYVLGDAIPFLENTPEGLVILGGAFAEKPIDMSAIYHPLPEVGLLFNPNLSDLDLDTISFLFTDQLETKEFIHKSFRSTDPLFRPAVFSSIPKEQYSDHVAIVKQLNKPVACFFGDKEKVHQKEYCQNLGDILWRSRVVEIPDAGHLLMMENPEGLAGEMKAFFEYIEF